MSGGGRRLLAGFALMLALSGCETTQQKSAELERAAHRRDRSLPGAEVVSVKRPSEVIEVAQSALVVKGASAAVAVVLRNRSAHTIARAPVEVEVDGAGGKPVYTNAIPGLGAALVSAPLLRPGTETIWVDDQVSLSEPGRSTKVLVGEGVRPQATPPSMRIENVRRGEGGQAATGAVVNDSTVQQSELVIYGVARRGGRIVAAGRAVVPELEPGASAQFELYLVGDTHGASLTLSAPPSTL